MTSIFDLLANDKNINTELANNFKTIKYSTENLICYLKKDATGQQYYEVWEKDSNDNPVATYIDMQHQMQLNNTKIPVPETDYKYFNEMCEIVTFLSEMED